MDPDYLKKIEAMGNNVRTPAYIGEVASGTPPRVSPIHVLSNALDANRDLCMRIDNLALRLVGPEAAGQLGQAQNAEQPSYVFPAIEQSANDAMYRILAAFNALDRIERALP